MIEVTHIHFHNLLKYEYIICYVIVFQFLPLHFIDTYITFLPIVDT